MAANRMRSGRKSICEWSSMSKERQSRFIKEVQAANC